MPHGAEGASCSSPCASFLVLRVFLPASLLAALCSAFQLPASLPWCRATLRRVAWRCDTSHLYHLALVGGHSFITPSSSACVERRRCFPAHRNAVACRPCMLRCGVWGAGEADRLRVCFVGCFNGVGVAEQGCRARSWANMDANRSTTSSLRAARRTTSSAIRAHGARGRDGGAGESQNAGKMISCAVYRRLFRHGRMQSPAI